jgi:hypothetical protein
MLKHVHSIFNLTSTKLGNIENKRKRALAFVFKVMLLTAATTTLFLVAPYPAHALRFPTRKKM